MAKNVILTEMEFKNIYRGYLKYLALQNGGVYDWKLYSESFNYFLENRYLVNHPNHTIEDFNEQDYDFDTVVKEDLDKGEFIIQEVDE